MTFETWIKRHTKTIFMAVIAVMAVTLVINFGPGGGCGPSGDRDSKSDAGTIFENIPVSRREFNGARDSAYAYARWKWLCSASFMPKPQLIQAIQRNGGRWWNDPKPDQVDSLAWERIILARYARLCGITTSKEDVAAEIRGAYEGAAKGAFNPEQYAGFVKGMFGTDVENFEKMVEDCVVIERLLALELDAPSADYPDLMKRILKDERRFRVDVVAISPDDCQKDLVGPGDAEILAEFEKNASKYQAPAKCQIEYLLADLEKVKGSLPEPAEDELKKYYDENKDEFLKPDDHDHAPGDGHDHAQKEYKPFDEVRVEIAGKLKTRSADKAVVQTMQKANTELGVLDKAKKDAIAEEVSKDPAFTDKTETEKKAEGLKRYRERSGEILEKLVEKFGKESGGLVHDITLPYSQKQVEEIEKIIGKSSGSFKPSEWIYKSGQVGDFVPGVVKTDKGAVLFRLARKLDSYALDLGDPLREKIVKDLRKAKLKELARKAAQDMVNKIQTGPNRMATFAEIRATRADAFKRTRYFKPDENGDLGLDDANLGRVAKAVLQGDENVGIGSAKQVDGSTAGQDKEGWSYVAVVSDVATSMPDGLEARFTSERDEVEKSERNKRREQRVKELVRMGNLVDKINPKKSDAPATP